MCLSLSFLCRALAAILIRCSFGRKLKRRLVIFSFAPLLTSTGGPVARPLPGHRTASFVSPVSASINMWLANTNSDLVLAVQSADHQEISWVLAQRSSSSPVSCLPLCRNGAAYSATPYWPPRLRGSIIRPSSSVIFLGSSRQRIDFM